MTFVPVPRVAEEQLIQTIWGNTVADDVNYLNGKLGVGIGSGATASRPATGTPGQLWYDTTLKRQWQWDGAAWALIAGSMPRCILYSTGQSIPNNVPTVILWGGEIADTDNLHSTASNTGRITIPAGLGGRWRFEYTMSWEANGTGQRSQWLELNASASRYAFVEVPSVAPPGSIAVTATREIVVVPTDYVHLVGYQPSGQALQVGTSYSMLAASYLGPV